ncbi:MAG: protein kinase [Bryobacteraceae bacterium]|nr:protein kinase [Bryobacteraceae bacterium]
MDLKIGDKLGNRYQLLSKLGEGGMGEVWKARDTELDRDVALKVSKAEFTARFKQEARAMAAFNHPNICHIHDVGPNYIVMEFIDGVSLTGPLPVEKAVAQAGLILDALDAAHRKGFTHRDLKPANVMVPKSGVLKLLDFGLAKQQPTGLGPDDVTIQAAMTAPGQITGTLQYMSPEQLNGKDADARSDIFAFGCVLYEMLSGKKAFGGSTAASVIAAIMEREPEPLTTAPPLDRVIRKCLAKDPDDRFQTARDAKTAMLWAMETTVAASPLPPRLKWLWPGVAALFALVAAVALWAWAGRAPLQTAPTSLSVVVPAQSPVVIPGTPTRSLAISPDGTQLVYVAGVAATQGGQPGLDAQVHLQLRRLDSLEVRDLPGTEGARQPFFSPDGSWVAFFAGSDLKKISLSGGNTVTLAEKAVNGSTDAFGVWSEDNTILFSTNGTGLYRVSAESGAVTPLTTRDAARGERSHGQPALVPGSRAVLFAVGIGGTTNRVEAVWPDSGKRTVVLENARDPFALSSGHLIFQRNGEIFIAPFDTGSLTVTGPSVPLGEQIRYDRPATPLALPEIAISRNGTFAYLPAVDTAGTLGLVGRDGTFRPLALPPANVDKPRGSPDGRSIAYLVNNEVYVYDLERGSTVKRTQDGRDRGIAWHPDSRSLTTFSSRNNVTGVFLRKPDGGEQVLIPMQRGVQFLRNFAWSPDGRRFAYTVQNGSETHIWILTPGENPPNQAFIQGQAKNPRFSPDGKWLAYDSRESGRNEVYLQQYPQGERLEVSTGGGDGPVWRSDGKELFFHGYALDGSSGGSQKKAMAASVTPNGASLRLGKPVPLFDLRTKGPAGEEWQYAGNNSNGGQDYDILPDGRFVMVRSAALADIREIVVVQNWFEALKRRAPVR